MKLPSFEDRYPGFSATQSFSYKVTNEEANLFRHLLRGRTFSNGGGVSSAGEIPLTVLLPKCEMVVVADHSYISLAAAMLKIAMLVNLGPEIMNKLLFGDGRFGNYTRFLEDAIASMKTLPGVLSGAIVEYLTKQGHSVVNTASMKVFIGQTEYGDIQREWFLAGGERAIREAYEGLDRISFIHGDLKDLVDSAPFDVFYLSNVTDHTHVNREGKFPVMEDFAHLVREGGLLLSTGASNTKGKDFTSWKCINSVNGYRTKWQYHVYERVVQQPLAVAV